MPKVTAASVALTALLAIGLAGCAGTPDATSSATVEPAASTETSTTTPTPTLQPTATLSTGEAKLLAGWNAFPEDVRGDITDDDVLAAGHAVCDQIADGVSPEDVRMEIGDGDEIDLFEQGTGGSMYKICPEF